MLLAFLASHAPAPAQSDLPGVWRGSPPEESPPPPRGAIHLPDLGDAAQADLGPIQERRLGEAIMREVRRDPAYFDDAELTDYVNALGYRLVAASDDSRQAFDFFLVKDSMVNAFALPGGFIGIHTGLILASDTESELASVMAHEIAHVTQRHIARMLAQQKQTQLLSIAALVFGILAARSNPDIAGAAIAGSQAATVQSMLNFTREHEREADRVGIQILDGAGYDVQAMPLFFEKLQRATRIYESGAPSSSYLRTHPFSFERMADLQSRAHAMRYRQVPDSREYQLARAKVRALTDAPRDAVAYFENLLQERRFGSEWAARYGLAAALLAAKDPARARKEIDALRKSGPAHPMIETLAGQVLLAGGDAAGALRLYRDALRQYPTHRALIYDYADALLRTGDADAALKVAQERLQVAPNDYRGYLLQGRAYAALNRTMLAHQSRAEALVRVGNLRGAVEQLQIAVKAGDGTFHELSSAEARLRELRRALDEQRKEQQGR